MLKDRVLKIIRLFQRYDPKPVCALDHSNPHELLFATILSAQCTDDRVNIVTKNLFRKFKKISDYAEADLAELEDIIRSTGFYKNKAKSIKVAARMLLEKHGGKVPKDLDDLVQLPGVGRKTANVVLGNAFNITSGIVVDTHVKRLSYRLGFTKNKTPEKIEIDLMKIVPKVHWIQISHWLIRHGRSTCKAQRPRCEICYLNELCPKKI